MSQIKNDLEFLKSLVGPFFQQAHIKRTLVAIQEESITGWEKWLQIEFASFLRDHEAVKSWGRESSYQLDQRVVRARKKCAVDFIVHQKRKHSFLALEVKQRNSPAACVQAMVKDLKKLECIRQSEYDIRSVWTLGVHKKQGIADVRREADYYADKLGVEIDTDQVFSGAIGKTGYSFSLI